jgi:hypothetical protein
MWGIQYNYQFKSIKMIFVLVLFIGNESNFIAILLTLSGKKEIY